ncbi:MAG: helix-turn-helix transcriptional regulator [Chloroflexota bacterium]
MTEQILLNSLGKRVRILRENMGLNQKEFAKVLADHGVEIRNKHVSDIERDQRNPSLDVLKGIAEVLGTTTDYLLLRSQNAIPDENEPNTLYIDPDADADVLQRMVDVFSSLARADQEMIIGMAQRLRETETHMQTPRVIGIGSE